MKFQANRTTLLSALNTCNKVISDHLIIPILSNIKLCITPGNLELTGSDLKMFITTTIDIESDFTLDICVDAKKLTGLVASLLQTSLNFEVVKNIVPAIEANEDHVGRIEQITYTLKIKTDNGKYLLPLELGEDYPKPQKTGKKQINMAAESFLSAIKKVLFAVSDNDLMPAFCGVNLVVDNGKITYFGTNPNFISNISDEMEGKEDIIIPKKTLQIIQSLNPLGELEIFIDKNSIAVNFGTVKTTSILIDEKPKDVLAVIPVNNPNTLMLDRLLFIASLKRLLPFTPVGYQRARMDISADLLTLTGQNIDMAEEAKEVLPHDYAGEDILICFNIAMMLGCLAVMESENVWLAMSTPNRAVVLTEYEPLPDNKENLMLVMPMMADYKG